MLLAKSNGRWTNGNGAPSEKWDFVEDITRFSSDQEDAFKKLADGKVIDLKSENAADTAPKSHPMGFNAQLEKPSQLNKGKKYDSCDYWC